MCILDGLLGGLATSSSDFGDERANREGQTGKSLPTFGQLLRRVEGTLAPKQNKTQADFFQLPDIIYGSYVLSWPLHEIRWHLRGFCEPKRDEVLWSKVIHFTKFMLPRFVIWFANLSVSQSSYYSICELQKAVSECIYMLGTWVFDYWK